MSVLIFGGFGAFCIGIIYIVGKITDFLWDD